MQNTNNDIRKSIQIAVSIPTASFPFMCAAIWSCRRSKQRRIKWVL